MKKVNCYQCDYVCRPAHKSITECETDDLTCCHTRYDGGAPIFAITECPKAKKK